MARDFEARLKAAAPAVAHELLAYWVAGITLDKAKRVAEIAIRRVPVFSHGSQARRDSLGKTAVVTVRVKLPPRRGDRRVA